MERTLRGTAIMEHTLRGTVIRERTLRVGCYYRTYSEESGVMEQAWGEGCHYEKH